MRKSVFDRRLASSKSILQNVFDKIVAPLDIPRICSRESPKIGHVEVGVLLGVIMHIEDDLSVGDGTCKGDTIGDRGNLGGKGLFKKPFQRFDTVGTTARGLILSMPQRSTSSF